jgi:hypothetical protein
MMGFLAENARQNQRTFDEHRHPDFASRKDGNKLSRRLFVEEAFTVSCNRNEGFVSVNQMSSLCGRLIESCR